MSQDYFEYLKSRSKLGLMYRQHWLYPKLSKWLQGKVLDVGCGIGDMLNYLPDTIGVDINPQNVDWCQKRGLNAQLMDRDTLPFPDSHFDGVILDNVLEHMSNPIPIFHEIHRVLQPNGQLVIGVPGVKGYKSDPDHKVFYDENKLHTTLDAAGFSEKQIVRMPLPFKFLSRILAQYCIYGIYRPRQF